MRKLQSFTPAGLRKAFLKKSRLAASLVFLFQPVFQPAAHAQEAAFAATTIGDFLVACQMTTSSCSSAVGTALLQRPDVGGGICLPNTDGDYTLPVIAWLKAHPETSSMTISNGTMLALQTVYRC